MKTAINAMEHSGRCTDAVYEALTGEKPWRFIKTGGDLLEFLREAGWAYEVIDWTPRTMKRLAIELPLEERSHPNATYYIITRGHAMAIHEGELIDFAARGFDGRHVLGVYRLTRSEGVVA